METIKAIIFDMDGVLFDTETFYYNRRKTFLKEKGISIDHLPPRFFIGGNTKHIWQAILGDDYENWDVAQLQAEYAQYKAQHPLPYKDLTFPDTVRVVQALKEMGYALGLASSTSKPDILRALDEAGIRDYFSVVLSGEEFSRGKPYPDIYEAAIKKLDVSCDEAIVVEDSEKGIQAATSAHLPVWAIEDRMFGMDQSKASRLLTDLGQLLQDVTQLT